MNCIDLHHQCVHDSRYKSKIQYSSDSYPVFCHHFSLPSLQNRRQPANLIFLHQCVHSKLDSSYLVGATQLDCPSQSVRNYATFRIPNSRINIRKHSVFHRYMTTINTLYLLRPIVIIIIFSRLLY